MIKYISYYLNTTLQRACQVFFIEQPGSSSCHARVADCVVIVRTLHIQVYVIPGLTRNPVLFRRVTLLDAGSSRHDIQKLVVFLHCYTACKAGMTRVQ